MILGETGGRSDRVDGSFTRGWTLQERIVPCSLFFPARNWKCVGTKRSLADVLLAPGCDAQQQVGPLARTRQRLLDDFSVVRRMSWASHRETTRVEDQTYSLMGIFSVNIPTIYGRQFQVEPSEGREAARAQKDSALNADDAPAGLPPGCRPLPGSKGRGIRTGNWGDGDRARLPGGGCRDS